VEYVLKHLLQIHRTLPVGSKAGAVVRKTLVHHDSPLAPTSRDLPTRVYPIPGRSCRLASLGDAECSRLAACPPSASAPDAATAPPLPRAIPLPRGRIARKERQRASLFCYDLTALDTIDRRYREEGIDLRSLLFGLLGLAVLMALPCRASAGSRDGWTGFASVKVPSSPCTQPFDSNPRVYIQPEYSAGPGIEPRQVMLYGLHFIHDYAVDRVRFEWLKEEGTPDQCDGTAGETWEPIATVGGVYMQALRGDPLVYKGQPGDETDGPLPDDLNDLVNFGASHEFVYGLTDNWYSYYDADADGLCSVGDTIILDANKNDLFNAGIDIVAIGVIVADGTALVHFTNYSNDSSLNPAYYWVDDDPGTPLSVSDWIFRENSEGYIDNGDDLPPAGGLRGLNAWRVAWSPCTNPWQGEDDGGAIGFSGAYIVRTTAIDRIGDEDVIDQHCYDGGSWNPNEIEPVTIDCSQPTSIRESTWGTVKGAFR
jgi:hypothetical protein